MPYHCKTTNQTLDEVLSGRYFDTSDPLPGETHEFRPPILTPRPLEVITPRTTAQCGCKILD
jgi:hypothetical protein